MLLPSHSQSYPSYPMRYLYPSLGSLIQMLHIKMLNRPNFENVVDKDDHGEYDDFPQVSL